jgi:hypothetical protein
MTLFGQFFKQIKIQAIFVMLALVFLVLKVSVVLCSLHDWQNEVQNSINKNVVHCNWSFVSPILSQPGESLGHISAVKVFEHLLSPHLSKSGFLAVHLLPRDRDVEQFRNLPRTASKANSKFPAAASKRGYHMLKWGAEKISRWEIPADHPGQNRSNCIAKSALVSNGELHYLYDDAKKIERTSYVLVGNTAYVHPTGAVGLDCGYYIGHDGCETRWNQAEKWWTKCKGFMSENKLQWSSLWNPPQTSLSLYKECADDSELMKTHKISPVPARWDSVFVSAALWDFNFHHFIADSLARIITSIKFLRAHPNIKIHIRSLETYDIDPIHSAAERMQFKAMRDRHYSLLGIDLARIVHGAGLAKVVYVPRNTRCSYALSNPIEMRLLARELLSCAIAKAKESYVAPAVGTAGGTVGGTGSAASPAGTTRAVREGHTNINNMGLQFGSGNHLVPLSPQARKNLIIQQRYTIYGSGERTWNNETTAQVVAAFSKTFKDHNIVVLRSLSSSFDNYCLECEILEYHHADVLVGAHGAGLTNMMYMAPNALVVEIAGAVKDVNMPECGYYGPLSAVYGHHHYLFGYDHFTNEPFVPKKTAEEAFEYYKTIHGLNKE